MDTSTKGAPRSKEFDDVYFCAQDGLAETCHVFLQSNKLPERFYGANRFVIAETGFGTGLNLLAVWKLFEEHALKGQNLHFISFEKYPLSKIQINEYLTSWREHFPELLDRLVEIYPEKPVGEFKCNLSECITLQLIFDDVNLALPQLDEQVDCWFLDGFKPSSNPEMWSETVFSNMARLSKEGTTFATFTAAGFVKRGLRDVGFTVEKVRGFGYKRDMLRGTYLNKDSSE